MKALHYLTLAGLLAASFSANATLYQFAYNFDLDDTSIVGTFEGTANGDLINIIEFESLTYTTPRFGKLVYDKNNVSSMDPVAWGMHTSFSGQKQSFSVDGFLSAGYLSVGSGADNHLSATFFEYIRPTLSNSDTPLNSSWKVSTIPEPATYGMLLGGLGAIGLLGGRRRPA